jgi:hypothetical protein
MIPANHPWWKSSAQGSPEFAKLLHSDLIEATADEMRTVDHYGEGTTHIRSIPAANMVVLEGRGNVLESPVKKMQALERKLEGMASLWERKNKLGKRLEVEVVDIKLGKPTGIIVGPEQKSIQFLVRFQLR